MLNHFDGRGDRTCAEECGVFSVRFWQTAFILRAGSPSTTPCFLSIWALILKLKPGSSAGPAGPLLHTTAATVEEQMAKDVQPCPTSGTAQFWSWRDGAHIVGLLLSPSTATSHLQFNPEVGLLSMLKFTHSPSVCVGFLQGFAVFIPSSKKHAGGLTWYA